MAFGKRLPGKARADVGAAFTPGSGPPRRNRARSHVAFTALAGVLLGFGGVTAGTTFVQASERSGILDFFESIFKPPAPTPPVAERPTRKRYASLPDGRRVAAPRERHFTPRITAPPMAAKASRGVVRGSVAAPLPGPVATNGPQTVCVRTCDGYLFPLGRLASQNDLPVHQTACAAACPNATTALFTLPAGRTELDQSVNMKGQPYLGMAWANVYRQKRVPNCSCQPPGVAVAPFPIQRDATLRVGDIVTTEDSADVVTKVVRGKLQLADYRSTRSVSRRARHDIDRQVGAVQREAADAAFRRSLRLAEAKAGRTRMAEANAARMRMVDADGRFGEALEATSGRQTFTPIRVVSQSVYER